jgi:nucleoside-diphosphate-sugar epimerase
VSSLTAVGPSIDGKPVTEKTEYHPVSHYGKSKMMGELEVRRASDRIPITIVRPSAVYGPRERDMFQYFRLIQRGIQPLMGFKNKLLSLIHSDDLVSGILLAGENPRSIGDTYFLGSEKAYSTEEIGNTIACVLNCHPITLRIPHFLVYTIGAAATVLGKTVRTRIFFNFQKAKESVQESWTCSIAKAKKELGFRQAVPLYEGMCATYQWYRENAWL